MTSTVVPGFENARLFGTENAVFSDSIVSEIEKAVHEMNTEVHKLKIQFPGLFRFQLPDQAGNAGAASTCSCPDCRRQAPARIPSVPETTTEISVPTTWQQWRKLFIHTNIGVSSFADPHWFRIADPYSQCGSGSGSSWPKWMRIRVDPNPQHWVYRILYLYKKCCNIKFNIKWFFSLFKQQ